MRGTIGSVCQKPLVCTALPTAMLLWTGIAELEDLKIFFMIDVYGFSKAWLATES